MENQTTIINRYVIQRKLGQGGMGIVYLAQDTQLDISVAIKHLKSDFAEPQLIERFRREGEALRELNHPNIVKLLNMFEDGDQHYLVMEYIAGGDVAALLQAGKLDTQQIIRYALDLADALTRAHKLNIIHRDLKPANILIAEDGTLRLTDFGIAQLGSKQRVTETDAIVGTLDYLAPEAFGDDGIDTRSDIWAFGVILFEMLTGQRPFAAATFTATLQQILIAPIPDIEALNPDAPIALIDLVYRMLERDPQLRISSVRYVGAALEDILQGRTPAQAITHRFDTPPQEIHLAITNNLPAQTTPFVGRETEVNALIQLLDNPANRLITILAPGGMGKTRLSLEVAAQQIQNFRHGAFFVELAPLTEPDDIITTLSESLGYQLQFDGRDVKQQVLDFLRHRSVLLIFDNFEHLLDGANIVADILKQAPAVKILATSRQRLNQSGETLYHLSGMDFTQWSSVPEALENGSVQLFLQSARQVRPDFDITDDNLDDVAMICQQVQGMPLGLILSASWLALLTPAEIVQEIMTGLDFFETEGAHLPDRQRSIRAIFDYSWNSMSSTEQQVFMKLSIFRGGFSRQAAQAVTGASLMNLMSLVNKSLIRRHADSGRYDMHELLRQYAEGQLQQQALTDVTRRAHVQYYVELAKQAEYELRHANQTHWYNLLGDEHDNLRAALGWSIEYDVKDTLEIIISARDFWFYQGHHQEAYHWMSKIREQEHLLDHIQKGRLYYSMGIITWVLGNIDEAEQLARQGVDHLRGQDSPYYLGWALTVLGSIIGVKDDLFDDAIANIQEAEQLFIAIDNKAGLAQLYNIWGSAYEHVGKIDLAVDIFERCIAISKETGEKRRISINQGNLARLKSALGKHDEALELMKQTITVNYEIGFHYMLASDLSGFAELLSRLNRQYDALVLLGANAAYRETLGVEIQPSDSVSWHRTNELARDALSDEQYEQAWQHGQDMSFEQAMAYALNIKLEDES